MRGRGAQRACSRQLCVPLAPALFQLGKDFGAASLKPALCRDEGVAAPGVTFLLECKSLPGHLSLAGLSQVRPCELPDLFFLASQYWGLFSPVTDVALPRLSELLTAGVGGRTLDFTLNSEGCLCLLQLRGLF